MRYRKKPVVIDAVQWRGDNLRELRQFVATFDKFEEAPEEWQPFVLCTLEGPMLASVGDWIIRGVEGELYPCKPSIFAATYEPAEADAP